MSLKAVVQRNKNIIMLILVGTPTGKFNAHRVVRSYTGDPRDELYEDKMEERRKLYQSVADEVNPIFTKLGD